MMKFYTVPAATEASKRDGEASEKERYVAVWVPDGEETENKAKSTDAAVPFVRRVGVAEQNRSCMAALDDELLRHHCSTGVMVAGGEACGECVVQTVLGSGSGIPIIPEVQVSLCRLRRRFPRLPIEYPWEGGSSVTVADGRRHKISQQTGVLARKR